MVGVDEEDGGYSQTCIVSWQKTVSAGPKY